jgi:hypothetical protein
MFPIWSVFFWGAWVPYTNLGYLRSVYANLRHVEDSLPWKHNSSAYAKSLRRLRGTAKHTHDQPMQHIMQLHLIEIWSEKNTMLIYG